MSQDGRQVCVLSTAPADPLLQEDAHDIEKEEEAKLKAKYPAVARPGPGFLQKRLQKGVCACIPVSRLIMCSPAAKVLRFGRLQHGEGGGRKGSPAGLGPVSPAAPSCPQHESDCADGRHDSHSGLFGDAQDIDPRAVQTGDGHVVNPANAAILIASPEQQVMWNKHVVVM